LRTAFKPETTVRKLLTKTKPKNPTNDSRNCVYEIPCECGRKYIGETCRTLQTRVREHKACVKKGETEKSRLADHAWSEQHHIQWDKARVIHKEEGFKKRKLKEATFMALTQNPISQPSMDMDPIWLPILRENVKLK